MNWKEELAKQNYKDEWLIAFIQSQFEKLIDDLESNPDPSIGHPITIPFWIELKQTQLRKKWL